MLDETTRRRELLGALGAAGAAALAGCSLGGDSDDGSGERAINPDDATVSGVLDTLSSTYESVQSYRADGVEETTIEMSELKGVDQVDEQELLEEWDGVLFDRTEDTEVTVDLKGEAYEQTGTESGEFLGQTIEQDLREYYVDGTLYEFEGTGNGWSTEEAEFDPPYNVVDFAQDASAVSDDLDLAVQNDGDSVALSGSFDEIPSAFQDEESVIFEDITSYEFEMTVSTASGRAEAISLDVVGNISNPAVVEILGVVPESADGEFTLGQEAEFLAHDESVTIELPEDAPAE